MKTVTVRIPVAVDASGLWASDSSMANTDGRNEMYSIQALREIQGNEMSLATCWITAEVPIPEPVEVEGRVEA